MCNLIRHRGPDDHGVYRSPFAQIGMRRLSIIDLSGGHQPIHNEDQTIWIVFNGEIYNFRSLKLELEDCGHRFYTDTDTECIVHAYEEYGDAFLSKLRGMFAIAILDLKSQRFLLARDRLGKKPLYYSKVAGGSLCFASELKSLFAVPGFKSNVSASATREYFSLGYVPGPGSIFEDVKKLPPAHYLVLESGQLEIKEFWKLDYQPKWQCSEEELTQRLTAELDDAVRIRLVSDVPFGAFLSGGLDSSVVATIMARNMNHPLKTFSIGFNEASFNELPDARVVAAHIGSEHHELVVTADAVQMLEKLAWHFDEPFGDSSAIPTYLVSQLAASHVKMVLSGDGGDEVFAGYSRYKKYLRLTQLVKASFGTAGYALSLLRALPSSAIAERICRIGVRMKQEYPERYLSGIALSSEEDSIAVLSPDLLRHDPYHSVRDHFLRGDVNEEMEKILSGDVNSYLVDDILVKVDRMTMANSLEARAPLLDHVLLEFCARLPYGLKNRGIGGKYLLRRAARELLPASCLKKAKQGFAIPLASWFRGDLRPLMQDILASRSFSERGVFNVRGVNLCFSRHLSGDRDFSEILWLVLTYELWARTFLDGSGMGQPVA